MTTIRPEEKLHLLRMRRLHEVYFVSDSTLTYVNGAGGGHDIYRFGLGSFIDDWDYEKYSRFYEKNGYQPPADAVGTVVPNQRSIWPGIEIMLHRRFCRDPKLWYGLMRHLGVDGDYGSPGSHEHVWKARLRLRNRSERFLADELYSPLIANQRSYQWNLLNLFDRHVPNPSRLFELRVLSDPVGRYMSWDAVDLYHANREGVRIDIDWLLANKVLAAYAAKN